MNGTIGYGSVADSVWEDVVWGTLDAWESGIDDGTEVGKLSAYSVNGLVSGLTSNTALINVSRDTEITIGYTISINQEESIDTNPTSNIILLVLITKILDTEVSLEPETSDTFFTAINITKHEVLAAVNGVTNTLGEEVVGETAEADWRVGRVNVAAVLDWDGLAGAAGGGEEVALGASGGEVALADEISVDNG